MIEAGKVLQQRYRIDKQIGQGGMGAVYVATDERFGSRVAIKETLFMDDNYRKAIEREARLLNSLKHSALPRVSDHFLEENVQFLVMEYIEGEDLGYVMEAEDRPFPVAQVLTWADQLLDALDFLHNQENPVIHRDIKPQNLKVTQNGQIILLDFGLAKGNPTDAGHQTAAKSIFGYSRNYASLEQIQGTGTDPRSDIYSLAATLYHLLTNAPPDDALTRAMAVLSQQPDPLLPANRIVPEIPGGVAGVLQKALALNAAQRPSSAVEMRAMLRDPDEHADAVATSITSPAIAPTEIHSARTKIMPGVTVHGEQRQTDIKTELMAANLSQVTELKRSAGKTAAPQPSRIGYIGAAIVAAVLTCSGGLYLYDPSLFGQDVTGEVPTANATTTVVQEPPVDSNGNQATTVESPVSNSASASALVTNPGSSSDKPSESTRQNRSQTANRSSAQTDRTDRVVVDGENVYIGNTRIRNGVVETPDRIIDENGVHPRPRNAVPPIPPPDLRNLTPEQRRRVMRALRRNGVTVPRPNPQ